MPPPAASTAEVVNISAGAAIRGLLLLVLLLRRVQASSPAKKLNAGLHASTFHFIVSVFSLFALAFFASWSCVAGISCVRTHTWVKILRKLSLIHIS